MQKTVIWPGSLLAIRALAYLAGFLVNHWLEGKERGGGGLQCYNC
jgi:hypothetical protein